MYITQSLKISSPLKFFFFLPFFFLNAPNASDRDKNRENLSKSLLKTSNSINEIIKFWEKNGTMPKDELEKMKENAKKMADLAKEYRTINNGKGEIFSSEENNQSQEENLNNDLESFENVFQETNNKGRKISKKSNPGASNSGKEALVHMQKLMVKNALLIKKIKKQHKEIRQQAKDDTNSAKKRAKKYEERAKKAKADGIKRTNYLNNCFKAEKKKALNRSKKIKNILYFSFFIAFVSMLKDVFVTNKKNKDK